MIRVWDERRSGCSEELFVLI